MTTEQMLWGIIVLLMSILATFFWFVVKDLKKRIEVLEKELKEIKTNYLDRFEGVKNHITMQNDKLIDKINELKIEMIEKMPRKREPRTK